MVLKTELFIEMVNSASLCKMKLVFIIFFLIYQNIHIYIKSHCKSHIPSESAQNLSANSFQNSHRFKKHEIKLCKMK